MPALADLPALRTRLHPLSVEAYHRLGESGQIGERTELIRGLIIDQMFQSPLHASIVELLREHLERSLPDTHFVRQEKPLTLADSEPEPDLAVVCGRRRDFLTEHPATARLVIEVCVSTEDLDRLKLALFAEAGVAECWLILAEQCTVERFAGLAGGRYTSVQSAPYSAALESTVFPGLRLPPAGFPPE